MTDKRTLQQNKSLQVACRLLAEILNDAGLDMQTVLKHKAVSVPWSQESVRIVLYKPIAEAMTMKTSTTDLNTIEISEAYDVLGRHLSELFGIITPRWPSDEPPMLEER